MPTWPGIPAGYKEPLIEIATGLFPDETMDVLEGLFGGGGNNDGRVIHTGPNTLSGVNDTLDAAEARGPYTIAYFPAGVYNLGTGLSLAGRTAQIQGAGSGGYDGGSWRGTVFHAPSQDGPVLDFTGWEHPVDTSGHGFISRVSHGDFAVIGNSAADASKDNAGVRLTTMSSAYFHDISVRATGGPGWEHASSPGDGVYLCDFERITVHTPVSAQTNDVPYFTFNESNGCRFRSIGIRATAASNNCGVSGAIVVKSNASYPAYDMLFDGTWIEFIHVPNGGCVIAIQANKVHFRDTGWHDQSKLSGATNTAYFRLTNPSVSNFGGNIISGHIPGSSGASTEIDYGVDIQQSRNRVEGVKGYWGNNVRIASGVGFTTVDLGGAESGAINAAVENNSTETTNVLRDDMQRSYRIGAYNQAEVVAGAGGAGPRFSDVGNAANGAVWMGNAGARIQGVGANTYITGDEVHIRNTALTPTQIVLRDGSGGVTLVTHTGDPNGAAIFVSPGSLCLSSDGTMWRKATGVGTNTGWVALS